MRQVSDEGLILRPSPGAELGDEGARVAAPGVPFLAFCRQAHQGCRHLVVHGCTSASRKEGGECFGDEEKQAVANGGFAFRAHGAQSCRDETARIEFCIPHRIPQRSPHDGACERTVDCGDVGEGDVGGVLIETRDGIGQIVIVDDDEIG